LIINSIERSYNFRPGFLPGFFCLGGASRYVNPAQVDMAAFVSVDELFSVKKTDLQPKRR
jgi:hypothetical protein